MRSAEIREIFLKFFEERGHTRVASSSLIPVEDPTLYFSNAGMVQFKEIFLGTEKRPYVRACSSQKCMRVSGKHNDLESVGLTPRHHTFFEMLGNFSFGDYFKKEAIAYAWEFLTEAVKLPKERLYVTVFEKDDEAEKCWQKHVAKERIFRFGEKDNFWAMGETGPCGPCSEIHWDFGSGPVTQKDIGTDRFMEIWNLVFMQFNRSADGQRTPLPKPSVDTGMGLERLACVLQGKKSNWETDLFAPLLLTIRKVTKGNDPVALRVIADHVRAASFLIADGLLPSNEGRGYVLRRILRRAIRYSRNLGMKKPFFAQVANTLRNEMGKFYPELSQHPSAVDKILTHEEEKFLATLDRGLEILEGEFSILGKEKEKVVPGEIVFKLYDTFGFPKDLTGLVAREQGFSIDETGFEKEMSAQRERARKAWKGSGAVKVDPVWQKIKSEGIQSRFVGYEKEAEEGEVLQVVESGQRVDRVAPGKQAQLVVHVTPFYAESGGQVGDTGMALKEGVELKILDTQKPFPDLFVHQVGVLEGELALGERLHLEIDHDRRQKIRLNHTATHVIHAALRQILGAHVKQAGSFLDDQHLRFDFSHFEAVSDKQLSDIEALANKIVAQNLKVVTEVLPYAEAVKKGALAFFGEKYGDVVRMVAIEGFSKELCGGTHVRSTGEIGKIKLVKERSVASGVRRIEAVTGALADTYREKGAESVEGPSRKKMAQRTLQEKSVEQAVATLGDVMSRAKKVQEVSVIAERVDVPEAAALREVADRVRQKLQSGIVVLGADISGKAALVVMVTKDWVSKYSAGDIMKKLAPLVGGTGGGRPDMAQGGGPEVHSLQVVLDRIVNLL